MANTSDNPVWTGKNVGHPGPADRLFVYGTLKDPDIRASLFGRRLHGVSAHVDNWGLFMGEDGYLFVKKTPGGRVNGLVLRLGPEDLEKADRWEDLTLYSRELCVAVPGHGEEVQAFIYTRQTGMGKPYHGFGLHNRLKSEIIRDIRKLFP